VRGVGPLKSDQQLVVQAVEVKGPPGLHPALPSLRGQELARRLFEAFAVGVATSVAFGVCGL
jgi:hypothetical protein